MTREISVVLLAKPVTSWLTIPITTAGCGGSVQQRLSAAGTSQRLTSADEAADKHYSLGMITTEAPVFPQSVTEQLNYYVYFLRDPSNKEVFYVGKGKGNRVFEHVACALADETETDKLDRIRTIEKSGKSVEHFVLRHGLTERAAFEVEAAVIDFVGIPNLSNLQAGHYSTDFGIKTTEEVSAMYSAPQFATDEKVLLININKLFNREMTETEIYDATRKSWVVGPRRKKAEYAVATYRGSAGIRAKFLKFQCNPLIFKEFAFCNSSVAPSALDPECSRRIG